MGKEITAQLPIGAEISDENSKDARVYHITKLLGRGGFGITYLAESTFYDNNIPQTGTYTIKEFCLSDVCSRDADGGLIVPDDNSDEFESTMKDFQHEAERLQSLRHRGIVPVNEVFHANGTVYYVMQFLGNTSLVKFVSDKGGRLSEDDACTIIEKLGQALDYLHQQRITHLDVKPENVMMAKTRKGGLQPVLIDFGLAVHYKTNGTSTSRHSATGVSDGYSPLEQYSGIDKFSPEADVYALGATFLFMLTGKRPPKAANMNQSILRNSISNLNLSNATTKALMGAMKKNAEDRVQNVQQFFHLLQDNDWDGHDHERESENDDTDKTKRRKSGKQTGGDGLNFNVKYLLITLGVLIAIGGGIWLTSRDHQEANTMTEQTELAEQNNQPTNGGSLETEDGSQNEPTQQVQTNTGGDNQSTNSNTTQTVETPPAPPITPSVTNGTKNLGYAVYRGQMKGGEPDGQGTLTFSKSHRYQGYQMEPGDQISGIFTDGELESGIWHKSDGTTESIMVGGI